MKYSFDREKHIHKLGDKNLIGTTTCLSIIDKAGLAWWSSGKCAEKFGWLNPKKHTELERYTACGDGRRLISNLDLKQYQEFLDKAYRAHHDEKEEKAILGTDLHAEIERFIKDQMTGTTPMFDYDEKIKPFIEWCKINVKRFLFSELCCYSETMWVGGIADFGFVDKDDNYVLGDIKSSKDAYFSQGIQLGGYDLQIAQNGGFTEFGDKVFTLMKPFAYHAIFAERAGIGKPFFNYKQVELAKQAFKNALALYKDNEAFTGFER